MKLRALPRDPSHEAAQVRDLAVLAEQQGPLTHRPCPGCVVACPCSGSPQCTCQCNRQCVQIPARLSSEGDRYPLEPQIAPLVFELACLQVCPPFWSCEGHTLPDGALFRAPQVWFYSRSLAYPRLMGEWMAALYAQKRLNQPWHVCLTYCESPWETGFSLEPDMKQIRTTSLPALQEDSAFMAGRLRREIGDLARRSLARVSSDHPAFGP